MTPLVLACLCLTAANPVDAPSPGAVSIATNFPGGNAAVEANEAGVVQVAPDLRGDRPWFYWCFEATATQPGRVTFRFPEQVAGYKRGAIGFQGPAVSTDRGETWRWMGTGDVTENAFTFDFAEGQAVRFAVTIPYVQTDWEKFLRDNAGNPQLETSVLTQSRHGRDVELLRVGTPGPDKRAVLLTCRHHATESIASFVLEGWLQAAMADTPTGEAFRRQFVLYSVPFVDKDGVEEGDQGKNRKPHDHNRDYGEPSLYPEVRAIKALDAAHPMAFALDLHCPTLVNPDHQVLYFVGAVTHPPQNLANVKTFAERIKNGLPAGAPTGPLVWLREESKPDAKSSRYFGFKEGVVMAATLEIPFAPPHKATDPDSLRTYGRVMLQAFVETTFLTTPNPAPEGVTQ